MKKTLVALAALAAVGTASAQSTVTLYGVADVWLGSTKTETLTGGNLTGTRLTKLDSGGYNGSRFGLRGTEDLGGGLKANFVLEQGIDVDSGGFASNSAGKQFGRQAYVGFSGGFGEVRLGRQTTAYDTLRSATNHSFDTSFAVTGSVWKNKFKQTGTGNDYPSSGGIGIADYESRRDNQFTYISPDFSGFSGALTYALGEQKSPGSISKDTTAVHLKYAAGPLLVGVAYQKEEQTSTVDRTYTLLAGSYDFGMAKVTAGFNRAKQDQSGKDNEYQLGVDFPVAPNARIALGYAYAKKKDASGASNGKADGYSLTGYYDLSKRTRLYAGLNSFQHKDKNGIKEVKGDLYAIGVRHSF
jgi:predicted porin